MWLYDYKPYKKVGDVVEIFPETAETVIQYAVLSGFIGIGFGAIIGVACRAVMSVVSIFEKFFK